LDPRSRAVDQPRSVGNYGRNSGAGNSNTR
jgi:hypothetical protein